MNISRRFSTDGRKMSSARLADQGTYATRSLGSQQNAVSTELDGEINYRQGLFLLDCSVMIL
jgi:hypothetical protein